MKRMIATLLVLALLLACVPAMSVPARAQESLMPVAMTVDADLATNDELFAAYAESVLYGIDCTPFGIAAGQRLTGDEKVLYDAMVPVIKAIASGTRSSTVIGIGQELFDGYPVDVPATFTGGIPSQESMQRVMRALLTDLPYEMYWFDKTTGWSYLYNTDTPLKYIQMRLSVAGNYAGSGEYTVDTAKTGAAATAAANARSIVNSLAAKSDYEKLAGYKDAICNLVSYNTTAADTGNFAWNNDPWQLIYVFDGNSSTNVVCEGYSKAFMYLCDLSDFESDVTCITVSGDAGGGHMWNIVSLGGKNYMVDVTNSDAGTIGSAGGLFLAGAQGSPSSGYRFLGYLYTYDTYTLNLWGAGSDSILTLASEDYDHGVNECDHSWTAATCTTPKTCLVCGETEGAPDGHDWVDATCEAARTCSDCGATEGAALGHDYTKTVKDAEHLKTAASKCTEFTAYWYGCSRCDANAKNDANATDRFWVSEDAGQHNLVDGKCEYCNTEDVKTGDLDGDGVIDNKDVAQLLWHTLFPETYPITGYADFNGDNSVDNEDVAYLLWHTLFPDTYPLT